MKSKTETLSAALRILANDIQSPDDVPATCLREAADRLEELQEDYNHLTILSDKEVKLLVKERNQAQAEIMRLQAGFEVHSKFAKERDEARDEVERLKLQNDQLRQGWSNTIMEGEDIPLARPEPSRLEIAVMLKAGWFANRDADFNATDHKWWIEQADKLIAAAKETK
jgi:hypothetical protein